MFANNLSKFTRYHSIRPLATLSYTADLFNNASIVSSIEFDKDNEFFAIAGVTKRIKIYDYNTVLTVRALLTLLIMIDCHDLVIRIWWISTIPSLR